ncbi:MAG: DUF456 domain-containing protein [Acidimicrobiia bacterium]|nr:DUF456 domain-containing protein [Acidimicrobiia bacterium]MDH4307913.1 DUF456 domain-containing protein [Acidimicrobiia bacterium]MDH5293778.1 DUF456 domain-containing protein [Acidimicrobiia bacterium]
MTASELLIVLLTGITILVGVAGTLVPVIPGLFLVWGVMALYGVLTGFGPAGWTAMALASVLVGLGLYLNVRIPQRAASGTGLSIAGQLLAVALAVVGFFAIPIVGAGVGFALGVYLIRLRSTKDSSEAWASTKTTLMSMLRASAAQALCGLGMFAVWLGWVAVQTL